MMIDDLYISSLKRSELYPVFDRFAREYNSRGVEEFPDGPEGESTNDFLLRLIQTPPSRLSLILSPLKRGLAEIRADAFRIAVRCYGEVADEGVIKQAIEYDMPLVLPHTEGSKVRAQVRLLDPLRLFQLEREKPYLSQFYGSLVIVMLLGTGEDLESNRSLYADVRGSLEQRFEDQVLSGTEFIGELSKRIRPAGINLLPT